MTQGALEAVYAAVLFVVGLAMGSFLNVVAHRAPKGISLLTPPSTCPQCGARIAAYDNLPVVGYLMLGGKCRACGGRIPLRYVLSEIVTGVLWAAVGVRIARLDSAFGFWVNIVVGMLWLAFVSAAVVTFIVDCDFLIVLDEISIGGLVVTVAVSPFVPLRSGVSALSGAAVGFGFSVFILYAGNAAFRRRIAEERARDPDIQTALGWGDVKLMAFYGAFLGWLAVFVIFVIASVSGAFVGAVAKFAGGDSGGLRGWRGFAARWRSGSSVIPFAPFLVVGALIHFFFAPEIFALLHRLGNP